MIETLKAALCQLVPDGAGVGVVDVEAGPYHLYAAEAAAIQRAIPARRAEFAAGRQAARDALEEAGFARAGILMGQDRAPIWPDGAIGSISHAGRWALAAVVSEDAATSIGFDLEAAFAVQPSDFETILTPKERAEVYQLPADQQSVAATRIFAAKEAFYKAQYPLTGEILDFQDVEIALKITEAEVVGNVAAPRRLALPPAQLFGRIIGETGHILLFCSLAPQS